MWRTLATATALALAVGTALAQSNTPQSPPSFGGCFGILVIYACWKRKGEEIGGWLMYYYIQVYLGLLVTIIMVAASIGSYRPSTWSDAPQLYPWFLISTVPAVLLVPIQLVVAERLRWSRNSRYLTWLRTVLWADLIVAVFGIAVDVAKFPDALALDSLTLLFPAIFLPYFYVSDRVRRVFVTRDWERPASPGSLGIARGPST